MGANERGGVREPSGYLRCGRAWPECRRRRGLAARSFGRRRSSRSRGSPATWMGAPASQRRGGTEGVVGGDDGAGIGEERNSAAGEELQNSGATREEESNGWWG